MVTICILGVSKNKRVQGPIESTEVSKCLSDYPICLHSAAYWLEKDNTFSVCVQVPQQFQCPGQTQMTQDCDIVDCLSGWFWRLYLNNSSYLKSTDVLFACYVEIAPDYWSGNDLMTSWLYNPVLCCEQTSVCVIVYIGFGLMEVEPFVKRACI